MFLQASKSVRNDRLFERKDTRYDAIVRFLAVILISFGILFRFHQYLTNRSLWLDEAMLALNIVHRPMSGLVEQLSYHQGAPLGFLYIEKLFILILGNTEYALRLFPIISGIASIFLFFYLVTNILTDLVALLSLALFVVSDWLIYYASEVKQYSSDVAIVLLLYVISLPLFRAAGLSPKRFIYWGVIGGISIWFSHPAVFILLAVSIGLLIHYFSNKSRVNVKWLALGMGIWLASILIVYWFALRFLADDNILVEFWNDFFMPMPPWSKLSWFRFAGCDFLIEAVGLPGCKLGVVLLIVGAVSLLLSNMSLGFALLLPFIIALSVSAMRLYPFGNRLILFLVPLALIFIAEGVDWISRWMYSKKWVALGIWFFLAILVLFWPTKKAFSHLYEPWNLEDIKSVMAYVQSNQIPGDQICIDGGAGPAYKYYAPVYKLTEEPCVLYMPSSNTPEANIQDIVNKTQPGRVWFLFSHKNDRIEVDTESVFLETVGRVGRTIDQYRSSGASVYLADIKK